MSYDTTRTITYHITATCDQCGNVQTWDSDTSPEWAEPVVGYEMVRPHPSDGGLVWFDTAACVHAFVEAQVITRPEVPTPA